MNLLDIVYTVQDLYQNKNGRKLTLEQLNRYLKLTNDELKRNVYGLVGEKDGAETEQQISDALLPFKTTATIVTTGGTGTLPTDYWHKLKVTTNLLKKITLVTESEFERRMSCSIDYPTTAEPIVLFKSTTLTLLPITVTELMLTYYKHDTPYIKATMSNYTQYSVVSDILWGQDKYIDFIRILLTYLKMPESNEQALQYLEQKTAQNN
jgi:hypothetical protein